MDQVRTTLSKQDPGQNRAGPDLRPELRSSAEYETSKPLAFGRTRFRKCALALKEAVFRPGQAEIFPQRLALILRAENPAPLHFRHHLVDEVLDAVRQ